MRKIVAFIILLAFLTSTFVPPSFAQALNLPAPGSMVTTTPAFVPLLVKGIKVHPENPLLFDFIVDSGKTGLNVNGDVFKSASQKLIKYFLASLTIKEEDLWVNLSPYEKDRIITDDLGKTELGRDMLAQDYILKQLTASMIYPEKDLGKAFWQRVYAKAQAQFGTSDIPVDTFNKVWITADKARVLEKNNVAYVVGAHLKVMLESDYVAASHQKGAAESSASAGDMAAQKVGGAAHDGVGEVSKQVIREIVLPELEKEVNEGQNFANLRQMFYAMILSTWYKQSLKGAFLNQAYANRSKTSGVLSDDPKVKEKIYTQYLEAYKKGVFNYIKEDVDALTQQSVPHKYFSGGIAKNFDLDRAMEVVKVAGADDAMAGVGDMAAVTVDIQNSDASMNNDTLERVIDTYQYLNSLPILGYMNEEDREYQRKMHSGFELIETLPSNSELRGFIKQMVDHIDEFRRNPRGVIPKVLFVQADWEPSDYMRKEFLDLLDIAHPDQRYTFGEIEDIQRTHIREELVNRDKLTGLVNNRNKPASFVKLQVTQQLPENGSPGAVSQGVVFLDINYFGSVNEFFGQDAGDQVLQAYADIMRAQFSEKFDLLLRRGGEEFAFYVSADEQHVKDSVDALQENVREATDPNNDDFIFYKLRKEYETIRHLSDASFVMEKLKKAKGNRKQYDGLLFQIVLQNSTPEQPIDINELNAKILDLAKQRGKLFKSALGESVFNKLMKAGFFIETSGDYGRPKSGAAFLYGQKVREALKLSPSDDDGRVAEAMRELDPGVFSIMLKEIGLINEGNGSVSYPKARVEKDFEVKVREALEGEAEPDIEQAILNIKSAQQSVWDEDRSLALRYKEALRAITPGAETPLKYTINRWVLPFSSGSVFWNEKGLTREMIGHFNFSEITAMMTNMAEQFMLAGRKVSRGINRYGVMIDNIGLQLERYHEMRAKTGELEDLVGLDNAQLTDKTISHFWHDVGTTLTAQMAFNRDAFSKGDTKKADFTYGQVIKIISDEIFKLYESPEYAYYRDPDDQEVTYEGIKEVVTELSNIGAAADPSVFLRNRTFTMKLDRPSEGFREVPLILPYGNTDFRFAVSVPIIVRLLKTVERHLRNKIVITPEILGLDGFDNSMVNGGIDLNARKMGMEIDKNGPGVTMSFDPAILAQFKNGDFTGVVPVILKVTPIQSLSDIL